MLHITGTRDNYHEMQSIFGFSNDLYDILEFDTGGEFSSKSASISYINDSDNSIHKARDFLMTRFKNIFIPDVRIIKKIPEGSGLGGGSSDAATFILYVAEINNIPKNIIIETAREIHIIGADTSIFIYKNIYNSKFVLLDGIGKFEELSSIQSKENFKIGIFPTPKVKKLSTQLVFDKFDENPIFERRQIFEETFDLHSLKKQKNSLQNAATTICPEITKNIESIQKTETYIARMSGSGSACFGLYKLK